MKRAHRYLLYEVTKACQNRCLFCYNVWKEDPSYPAEELSPDESLRLLDKVIGETGCSFIGLTGGEPLLRDDLCRIAAFLVSKNVTPVLISNGALLSREMAGECVRSGVKYFEVSLHGAKPEVHDRLAGRAGSFEEVVEAIINVKSTGGNVNTVFVGTRDNIGRFREYVELCAMLRVEWILFNRVACGGTCVSGWEDLVPSPRDIVRALEEGAPVAEKYRIGLSAGVQMQPCLMDLSRFPNVASSFCPLNNPTGDNSYFAIDPAGNLRMCNRSRVILGNLLREPFERVVEHPAVDSYSAAVPAFCAGCALARSCAGGCKADAFSRYATLEMPDPYLEKHRAEAKKISPKSGG